MSSAMEPATQQHPPDPHHAWQGLSLAERSSSLPRDVADAIKQPGGAAGYDHEQATLKLNRWQRETGLTSTAKLAERLRPLQLNETTMQFLLGETTTALQARMPGQHPRWQRELEMIYCTATAPAGAPGGSTADDQLLVLEPAEASTTALDFLEWLRPLIQTFNQQLTAALRKLPAVDEHQANHYAALVRPALCLQLYRMSQRTLLLELQLRRVQGLLQGETPQQRYQGFINLLQQPHSALQLFAEYPVLARQLLIRARQWCAVYTEFFHRFTSHRQQLAAAFNNGRDPGTLIAIDAGRGDRHADGRSVLVLQFTSGLRLVYKPKPLQVDSVFQRLLGWLNAAGFTPGLPQLKLLDCGDYGWCEFIAHTPCSERDAVARFYQRQGGYLALLFALEATDFHYENIIAHGERPYLIDLETLLQPYLKDDTAVGPGSRMTTPTIMRCGMLPNFHLTYRDSPQVDLSGLGNSHGRPTRGAELRDEGCDTLHLHPITTTMPAGANQPLLGEQPQQVQDYREHVQAGFSRMYRLLLAQRDTLLRSDGPLSWFANCRLRYLIRGTDLYVRLLHAAFHPDYLQHGLMRDRLFDKLWLDYDFYPAVRPLIPSEQDALARSDVPLFLMRSDSTDLYDDRGRAFPGFFPCSGLEQSYQRLRRFNHDDLQRQYRLLRDCLGGMQPHPWDCELRPQHPLAELQPPALVDGAQLLAWRIRRQAIHHNGYVGWLQPSFQGLSGWVMNPCAVSLYDGLAGIALFFATLGRLTGTERDLELAHLTWHTARRRILDNPKALQCVGAYAGWGGMFYTAAHLAALDMPVPDHTEIALWYQRLRRDLPQDRDFDFIAGSSGAIMGLLRWHQHSGDARALELAVTCGDYLLQHAQPHSGGLAWTCGVADGVELTGLGHGAAGIAQALLSLGQASGDSRFNDTAQAAIAFENAWYSTTHNNWLDRRKSTLPEAQRYALGWCHGAPGIGLARLKLLALQRQSQLQADLHHAVTATMNGPWGYNQSLCHGDLGNLELIHRAGHTLNQPQWVDFCTQQLRWLLPLIRENHQRSGLQNDAETYGMMNGFAGMGYALLRFAWPDKVPSLLTLD